MMEADSTGKPGFMDYILSIRKVLLVAVLVLEAVVLGFVAVIYIFLARPGRWWDPASYRIRIMAETAVNQHIAESVIMTFVTSFHLATCACFQ